MAGALPCGRTALMRGVAVAPVGGATGQACGYAWLLESKCSEREHQDRTWIVGFLPWGQ